jgi:hypothetical protein
MLSEDMVVGTCIMHGGKINNHSDDDEKTANDLQYFRKWPMSKEILWHTYKIKNNV